MFASIAGRTMSTLLALVCACSGTATLSTVAPYETERSALDRALRSVFITPEGGVKSYAARGTQEDTGEAGTGYERTSESSGLLLAYAVARGDRTLFTRAMSFYQAELRAANSLAYWKLDERNRPVPNDDGSFSSAPIDELRIARALLAGESRFSIASARTVVRSQARALRAAVRGGVLSDDVSWDPWEPAPGDRVLPAYVDYRAMRLLSTFHSGWASTATSSLTIVQRAARFRPPRTAYDPRTARYSCDEGTCGTIAAMWMALHLLDAGDRTRAAAIYSYYRDVLARYGRLPDAISAAGRASADEDLASYALMARLAWRLGSRDAARALVRERIAPARVRSGSLSGLYSLTRGDAPAFDNLEIGLTLAELAGAKASVD